MANYTPSQLYALARNVGLDPTAAVIATAVALGESGGNPDAVGDTTLQTSKWGPSVGLWQIRSLKAERGTGGTRDETRLRDPEFNARSMAAIYKEAGSKFTPWSVFTSGSYRTHLAKLDPEQLVKDDIAGISLPNLGGIADAVGGVVSDAADKLNPFSAFEGWQNDLQGVLLKLAVTGAALFLVVAGVKSAAGADE